MFANKFVFYFILFACISPIASGNGVDDIDLLDFEEQDRFLVAQRNCEKTRDPTGEPNPNYGYRNCTCDDDCDSSAYGDPHFRMWSGRYYDFQNECDMIHVRNSLLDLHIRTKYRGGYSAIETAVLRINSDILEVYSDGTVLINTGGGWTAAGTSFTLDGLYPVAVTNPSANRQLTKVSLSGGQSIEFDIFGLPQGRGGLRINIDAHGSDFCDSQGMAGDWDLDGFIARDGITPVPVPGGANKVPYGVEWEVDASLGDPLLFSTTTTKNCIDTPSCDPSDPLCNRRSRNRNLQTVNAQAICEDLVADCRDLKNCIFDVNVEDEQFVKENPAYTEGFEGTRRCIAIDEEQQVTECETLGGECAYRCNEATHTCIQDLCVPTAALSPSAIDDQGYIEGCSCAIPKPTDPPSPTEPPVPPTPKPTPSPYGTCDCYGDCDSHVYADPHFKMWNGRRYDFQWQCDMVHVTNSLLDLHIRTEYRGRWSAVAETALRFDTDILEVKQDGAVFLNGVIYDVLLPLTLDGLYPVSITPATAIGNKVVKVFLDAGQYIQFSTRGAGGINIYIDANGSDFCDSEGTSGNWQLDGFISRDGVNPVSPLSAGSNKVEYGIEWEVDAGLGDPILFSTPAPHNCEDNPSCDTEDPNCNPDARDPNQDELNNARERCKGIVKDLEDLDNCAFDLALLKEEELLKEYTPYYDPYGPTKRCLQIEAPGRRLAEDVPSPVFVPTATPPGRPPSTIVELPVDFISPDEPPSPNPVPTPSPTDCPATSTYWSAWLDVDNPSGIGDFELITDDVCGGCAPLDIECETLDGIPAALTGQNSDCDPTVGFFCQNEDQPNDEKCLDYKVRYLCPSAEPPIFETCKELGGECVWDCNPIISECLPDLCIVNYEIKPAVPVSDAGRKLAEDIPVDDVPVPFSAPTPQPPGQPPVPKPTIRPTPPNTEGCACAIPRKPPTPTPTPEPTKEPSPTPAPTIAPTDCPTDNGGYPYIAGYMPRTDANECLRRDLIQKELEELIADESCTSFDLADDFYNLGNGQYYKTLPTYSTTDSDVYEEYTKYYGKPDFIQIWASKAIKKTKTNFNRGNAKFNQAFPTDTTGSGNCVGFEEVLKKGLAYTGALMEVYQLVQQAIDQMQGGCYAQSNGCQDALEAIDCAVATYVGSLEGEDGNNDPDGDYGKAPYALADRRCRNFKNCGPNSDSDAKDQTSPVNTKILSFFAAASHAAYIGDWTLVEKYLRLISNTSIIPFVQGTMRYYYRLSDEEFGTDSFSVLDKEVGEGGAFAFGALPKVWACSKKGERKIYAETAIGGGVAGVSAVNFQNIKLGFECNYKCLGITCDEVGDLYDGDPAPKIGAEKCSDKDNGSLNVCAKSKGQRKKACKLFTGSPGIKGRNKLVF